MIQVARAAASQLTTSGDAPRVPVQRVARRPAVRTSISRRGCSSLLPTTIGIISRFNPVKQKGLPNHRQVLLFQRWVQFRQIGAWPTSQFPTEELGAPGLLRRGGRPGNAEERREGKECRSRRSPY